MCLLRELFEHLNGRDGQTVIWHTFIAQNALGEAHIDGVALACFDVVLPPMVSVTHFKDDLSLTGIR